MDKIPIDQFLSNFRRELDESDVDDKVAYTVKVCEAKLLAHEALSDLDKAISFVEIGTAALSGLPLPQPAKAAVEGIALLTGFILDLVRKAEGE